MAYDSRLQSQRMLESWIFSLQNFQLLVNCILYMNCITSSPVSFFPFYIVSLSPFSTFPPLLSSPPPRSAPSSLPPLSTFHSLSPGHFASPLFSSRSFLYHPLRWCRQRGTRLLMIPADSRRTLRLCGKRWRITRERRQSCRRL